ncbi:hypothetical protein [Kribbella catacumbae]|uniref:hypothetical protein n=1 Tax=Kribbella catacumbae TaxID=460086 RepID=UPI00037BF141|nr:hypothetical protein [Kribbella catacumbae]
MTQYEFKTRKPTGKPGWPFILLAGAEKSGKSWAWAEFSASNLVGRTYVVPIGEVTVDEYGAIPGADFDIVEHDGSYNSIINGVWAASRQDRVDGKPNCIVVDSGTQVWDLLGTEQQSVSIRREKEKAKRFGNRARPSKPSEEGGPVITMDQWNVAKSRWYKLVDLLRKHDGPVIITTRLEEVTVLDKNGKPTTDKTMKVRAEKNLPFDATCIVEMPRRREAYLTGVVSTRLQLEPGDALKLDNFKIENLLVMLGLDGEVGERDYTPLSVDAYVEEEVASWAGPQDARQASQRPADRPHGSTAPAGGERVSRPAAANGPDPQVVHDFIGEMEQIPPGDVLGWRKAYARAQQLGIMAVPIPSGVDGERIQLGTYLMRAGTHAATLAPASQPGPADDEEIAGSGISGNGTPGEVGVIPAGTGVTVASGR